MGKFKKLDTTLQEKPVKVIFRKFKNGEIIALFPELPGSNKPSECLSYLHIGQHGSASIFLYTDCKLAKPEEYEELYNELIAIGYKLQIVKRITRLMDLERKESLNC
jgi:hypothetical protein